MVYLMFLNFRKIEMLSISWDVDQKVKVLMSMLDVSKVELVNISKDLLQKFMFFSANCPQKGYAVAMF